METTITLQKERGGLTQEAGITGSPRMGAGCNSPGCKCTGFAQKTGDQFHCASCGHHENQHWVD
jgi:hypothetical protein